MFINLAALIMYAVFNYLSPIAARVYERPKNMKFVSAITVLLLFTSSVFADPGRAVIVGAERMSEYLALLEGKTVGLVVNHTSIVGPNRTHLVDTLLAKQVRITKVYAPEHGFRGLADAGLEINSNFDSLTGLPIISLYGTSKKPSPEQLQGVEIIVFDIQDVGARFYTYINTMFYVMQACSELGIPVIVLDRPNPNGFYVDGPILEDCCTSFVGLLPIPVVHGVTVGELAEMINGENWLGKKDSAQLICQLTVVPCKHYTHNTLYELPVKPSPNLPNMLSVYLYPSVCFFEGTMMSLGRGTYKPFQIYGHPDFLIGSYEFTPTAWPGAQSPPLRDKLCKGFELKQYDQEYFWETRQINIQWLMQAYDYFKSQGKDANFFTVFFEKLAGTTQLRQSIIAGLTEAEIRLNWADGLTEYKAVRKKYLLYPDFKD